MPFRNMEQGINAIREGKMEEGARLLRIALKDPALSGKLRAVALTWMAETSSDSQYKLDCYKEALAADPGNEDVNQRIAHILSTQLPREQPPPAAPAPGIPAAPQNPMPNPGYTPTYGQPPVNPAGAPPAYGQSQPSPANPAAYGQPNQNLGSGGGLVFRTVGVVGGPNGSGTAFFVSYNGLVATTRYVVGGVENVTIALDSGRSLPGRVVRAFPEFDLAFIHVDLPVSSLLPVTNLPYVPDDARLVVVAHNGQVVTGQRRTSKRQLAAHWFPTTIKRFADAGGDPIFDDHNYLVGMLTKNISRSSGYAFGLHISAVQKCLENYTQELTMDSSRTYCSSCGHASRAAHVKGFYCEVCGGVLSHARHTTRFPLPQAAAFYGENVYQPCPHCGSRLGFYNGACLRCGGEITTRNRQ